MANFVHKLGRRVIYFTDHALDRWWERFEQNSENGRQQAMDLLRERLVDAEWRTELPPWARISLWHRAMAEGFIYLDETSGFVVNRDLSGERVAVTYIDDDRIGCI